jgi:sirohydrochlorin ferrochelatase/(2Fe-2S) ferredoxin
VLPKAAVAAVADTCVLFIGHGSRDAGANPELEAVVSAYRASRPALRVEVAYIELATPLLANALAAIAPEVRQIVVVPLFLFAAGHVKNDLPLAVDHARRRFPSVHFAVAPCLGVHPSLVSIAYERAAAALPDDPLVRARTLLLVVGRGSSDPDANGDFCKVARLIGEGRDLLQVEPAFLGITQPSVETSLELVARVSPAHVVVLPYLLFRGRLMARLAAQVEAFAARHPWIRASLVRHLADASEGQADPRLLSLIDERAVGALEGTAPLPCDTCQYRTPFAGRADQVGGLRALLYSARHALTHAQATMPVHLHRPLKKHVFVCGNADCVDRGSVQVLDIVRREVKRARRARDIKVTRASCMGRCGEGPSVAVYPDGVWYRGVRPTDASAIVQEHLLHDRLVGHLVDDILQ